MRSKYYRTIAASVFLCLLGMAHPAWAGPADPITVERPPEGQGDMFVPGTRLIENLAQAYVEEEFFISGAATLFSYAHNPPLGPTDTAVIQEGVPYRTRVIVRWPSRCQMTA